MGEEQVMGGLEGDRQASAARREHLVAESPVECAGSLRPKALRFRAARTMLPPSFESVPGKTARIVNK